MVAPIRLVPFLMVGLLATACRVSVEPLENESPAPAPTGSQTPSPDPGSTTNPPAETPPNNSVFYGACLTELAFEQASKVINFYAIATQTSDTVSLSLHPLALESGGPPKTVSPAGVVGDKVEATSKVEGGLFTLSLGTVKVPGAANPISGSDIVIEKASLSGTLSCAFLSGDITQPAAAARSLDATKNVCRFSSVKDGAPTPTLSAGAFKCSN